MSCEGQLADDLLSLLEIRMRWLEKLHEAQAEVAVRNGEPLATARWNVCTARSATMASSGLPRSYCWISLRSLRAVEEPALADVWRSSWRS